MTFRTVGGKLPCSTVPTRTNLVPNPSFRATSGTVEVRRNLATNPLSDSLTAAAPWIGTRGALSLGAGYLRLTVNDATTGAMSQRINVASANYQPVSPGDVYTISYDGRNNSGSRMGVWYLFLQADKVTAIGSGTFGGYVTVNDTTWTRSAFTTVAAPAGAAYVAVYLGTENVGGIVTIGSWMDFRHILIELTGAALAYFDGSTAAAGGLTYSWTGTANASASIATGDKVNGVTGTAGTAAYRDPARGVVISRPYSNSYAYFGPARIGGTFPTGTPVTYSAGVVSTAGTATNALRALWDSETGTTRTATLVAGTRAVINLPAAAVNSTLLMYLVYPGPPPGEYVFSDVTLEVGTTAGTPFDGSKAETSGFAYRWTGTVDGSTSEEVAKLSPSVLDIDGVTWRSLSEVKGRVNMVPNPTFRNVYGNTSEVRRNLLTNPSGENAAAGWNSNNATNYPVSWDTTVARSGLQSRKSTQAASTGRTVLSLYAVGNANTVRTPVTPGKTYTLSVYLRAGQDGYQGNCGFIYYDDSLTQQGSPASTYIPTPAGQWVRVSYTATIPANVTSVYPISSVILADPVGTAPIGAFAHADDALMEESDTALPYFDGTSAPTDEGWTCSWVGTANASASVVKAPIITGNMYPYAPVVGGKTSQNTARYLFKGGATNSLWAFQGDALTTVNAGDYVAGRMQVRQITNNSGVVVTPRIGYYGGSFVKYLSSPANVTVPADGSWVDCDMYATAPADGTGASARLMLYRAGALPPAGTMLEVRNCIMEKVSGLGNSCGQYFDGSNAADTDYTYSWSGTPDLSFSNANP